MEWRLKALRRVASMPHEDRVAYQSARTMNEQAETLYGQGKYAEALPLFEKALEIRRGCSPTITPTPLAATTTWQNASTHRASTPRLGRIMKRPWRSTVACSPTTTPTPP